MPMLVAFTTRSTSDTCSAVRAGQASRLAGPVGRSVDDEHVHAGPAERASDGPTGAAGAQQGAAPAGQLDALVERERVDQAGPVGVVAEEPAPLPRDAVHRA